MNKLLSQWLYVLCVTQMTEQNKKEKKIPMSTMRAVTKNHEEEGHIASYVTCLDQ